MTDQNSLAVQDPGTRELAGPRAPHHFSVMPKDLGDAMEIAKLLSKSTFIPKAFQGNPGDVLVVMMQAAELQIPYFAALHNTAVINGRPTIWGDLVTALLQRSGQMEYCLREWDEETQTATCRLKRKGFPECVRSFSMADAKRAKLSNKDTYQQYPQRMCGWRAFSWAARDEFADVLKGMQIAEEVLDIPGAEVPMPIQQPRPLKELVADFQAPPDTGKPKKGKAAAAAATAPAGAAPASSEVTTEIIKPILSEMAKEGVNPKTKNKWTLFRITADDGREFATFSSTVFEVARKAAEMGVSIHIATKPGQKGPIIEEAEAALETDEGTDETAEPGDPA